MAKRNKPTFHCKSNAQKKAIAASYARKAEKKKSRHISAPYPHFRYYKKSGHPALIVGEQKGEKVDKNGKKREVEEYRYRKVMHGGKEGGRNNEIIYPNPNPKDPEPMGIAKRVRHDEKENFEEKPLPWKYPKN